jgi:hypothetical protein
MYPLFQVHHKENENENKNLLYVYGIKQEFEPSTEIKQGRLEIGLKSIY